MKLNTLSARAKIIAGLTLAILMLILISLVMAAWSMRQEGNAQRAEIEPRIARLLGVQQQYDKLKLANLGATAQLTGLVYSASADATMTGTKMQQDVREVIELSGMTVVGSRVRAVKVADGYDKISLDLTVEGGVKALESMLLEIPKLRPIVVIEETNITPKRGRNLPHILTARFRLTAARLQP